VKQSRHDACCPDADPRKSRRDSSLDAVHYVSDYFVMLLSSSPGCFHVRLVLDNDAAADGVVFT
jgi:hypothetical protein